jgi:hypothetical protein
VNRSRRTRDRGSGPRRPSRLALLECSDEQLVEFVLDGYDAAFEVLFDRHVADSLWYAREVLGTWGEAEEAVRHSFAAAHAYLAARGSQTEFRPWLQTILGNYCLSMLQARATVGEQSADNATVVDLGEWRLRRKLFGISLPIAPAAGLRDAVMAACGIGAGSATTAGAPLFGGTLAKLAVVAVLAGGAGVAGDVTPERAVPADAGGQMSAERFAADAVGSSPGAIDEPARKTLRRVSGTTGRAMREHARSPRERHKGIERRDRAQVAEPPSGSTPSTGGKPGDSPAPALDPTSADAAPVSPVSPLTPSALGRTIDVVKTQVPAVGGLAETKLGGSADLSKIGDDLGVTAIKPPVDVRGLLSRGTSAPSK